MLKTYSFKKPSAVQVVRGRAKMGQVSIICSKKNGKRVEILPTLCEELKIEDAVAIAYYDKGIAISVNIISDDFVEYKTKGDKKKIIYSTKLVEEISNHLGLDFTNRVSITLCNVILEEEEGIVVALVSMEDNSYEK